MKIFLTGAHRDHGETRILRDLCDLLLKKFIFSCSAKRGFDLLLDESVSVAR